MAYQRLGYIWGTGDPESQGTRKHSFRILRPSITRFSMNRFSILIPLCKCTVTRSPTNSITFYVMSITNRRKEPRLVGVGFFGRMISFRIPFLF